MNSSRPYLIRALYDWILDNECTPYLLVDVNMPHVNVPKNLAQDGQIVLNISPNAAKHLLMDNVGISFEARFSGIVHRPYVPTVAIKAIYAKENGQGMFFEYDPSLDEIEDPDDPPPAPPPRNKPSLKVVK